MVCRLITLEDPRSDVLAIAINLGHLIGIDLHRTKLSSEELHIFDSITTETSGILA
jgi:hypothetical protein